MGSEMCIRDRIYSRFTFPGRQQKYSDFIWDKHCFIGTDYDAGNQRSGIFIIQDGHGKWWEEDVSEELGNFDYLMYNDLDYRNPHVKEELKKWIEWLYGELRFDGLRMDAMKHIAPYFTLEFIDHIRTAADKEIFAVGEFWSPGDAAELVEFISRTEEKMHLFDAPLQSKFHNASKQGAQFDLRTIFENTLTSSLPDKSVTFIANHDTQPLRHIESPVDPWFKPLAYALILLRREGYPCVFYPDLFGADYRDHGQDGNEHEVHMPKVHKIEELMTARKQYAYGEQFDYFDDPNCIAWVRSGQQDMPGSGCVVVLSNAGGGSKQIHVGLPLKGVQFHDMLGNVPDTVRIDDHGNGAFTCQPGSVSVWVKAESILIGDREIPIQEVTQWVNLISHWGKRLFSWLNKK